MLILYMRVIVEDPGSQYETSLLETARINCNCFSSDDAVSIVEKQRIPCIFLE